MDKIQALIVRFMLLLMSSKKVAYPFNSFRSDMKKKPGSPQNMVRSFSYLLDSVLNGCGKQVYTPRRYLICAKYGNPDRLLGQIPADVTREEEQKHNPVDIVRMLI